MHQCSRRSACSSTCVEESVEKPPLQISIKVREQLFKLPVEDPSEIKFIVDQVDCSIGCVCSLLRFTLLIGCASNRQCD